MSLYTRACDQVENGNATFQLTCDAIDAGSVLLLMHAATLTIRQGWKVSVGGVGDAWDHLLKHVNHYLSAPENRSTKSDEQNFWLRDISSKDQMVDELQKWAELVQEGSGASDEDVALWQFQISEVTANSFQHGPIKRAHACCWIGRQRT